MRAAPGRLRVRRGRNRRGQEPRTRPDGTGRRRTPSRPPACPGWPPAGEKTPRRGHDDGRSRECASRCVVDGHLGTHGEVVIGAAPTAERELTGLCRKAGSECSTATRRERGTFRTAVHPVAFPAWLPEPRGAPADMPAGPGSRENGPAPFGPAGVPPSGRGSVQPRSATPSPRNSCRNGAKSSAVYTSPRSLSGGGSRAAENTGVEPGPGWPEITRTGGWGPGSFTVSPQGVQRLGRQGRSYAADGIVVRDSGRERVPESRHGDPGGPDFPRVRGTPEAAHRRKTCPAISPPD